MASTAVGSRTGVPLGEPKRRRITTRCTFCRKHHLKCHGGEPCSECGKRGLSCIFPEARKRGPKKAQDKKRAIEQTISTLVEPLTFGSGMNGLTIPDMAVAQPDPIWQTQGLVASYDLNRYATLYRDHYQAIFPLINAWVLEPSVGPSIETALRDPQRPGRRLEITAALTFAATSLCEGPAVRDLNAMAKELVKEAIVAPSADMANGMHILALSNICADDPLYPVLLLSNGEAMLKFYDLVNTDFQATACFTKAAVHFSSENFEVLCASTQPAFTSWPRRPIGIAYLALSHLADGTRDTSTIDMPMVLQALDEYAKEVDLIPAKWARLTTQIVAFSMRSLLFWRHGHQPLAYEWAIKTMDLVLDPAFEIIPVFMSMFSLFHIAHIFYIEGDLERLELVRTRSQSSCDLLRPVGHFHESYLVPRINKLRIDGKPDPNDAALRESFLLHKIPIVKAKSMPLPTNRLQANLEFSTIKPADSTGAHAYVPVQEELGELIDKDPWPCDYLNDMVKSRCCPTLKPAFEKDRVTISPIESTPSPDVTRSASSASLSPSGVPTTSASVSPLSPGTGPAATDFSVPLFDVPPMTDSLLTFPVPALDATDLPSAGNPWLL